VKAQMYQMNHHPDSVAVVVSDLLDVE